MYLQVVFYVIVETIQLPISGTTDEQGLQCLKLFLSSFDQFFFNLI